MKRPRGAISRAAIVVKAFDIADRGGLEAASVRRLAAEFGVTPMALYHHFHDKADLWAAMADRFWAEVGAPDRSGDWSHDLRWLLLSFIGAKRRHPCASALLQKRTFSPAMIQIRESALEALKRAGFDPTDGIRIIQQLTALFVEPANQPPLGGLEPDLRLSHSPPADLWDDWADDAGNLELGVDIVMLGVQALLKQTRRGRERT